MHSPSVRTKVSKSSLASSAVATVRYTHQPPPAAISEGNAEVWAPEAVELPAPKSRSSSISTGGASSRSTGASTSYSVPESEARWSDLPALKPLVNPHRLQALRLSSRDSEANHSPPAQQQASRQSGWLLEAVGGGDTIKVPSPPDRLRLVSQLQQQQQQQQRNSREESAEAYARIDASSRSSILDGPSIIAERNQCNSQRRVHSRMGIFGDAADVDTSCRSAADESASLCDDAAATVAASATMRRQPIYQYSFRVPETRTNMRAFSHATDRRIESIARACDSEILLDPQPIRSSTTSVSLRRVTIRAPDLRSLEKCCRMFDDKFPQFYASSGLGPDGRGVSMVYDDDDDDERYITASNDDVTFSTYS